MIAWGKAGEPLRKPLRRMLIGALFVAALVVALLRARQLAIAAPDVVRYIQQAQMLPVHPLLALRSEVYHPLFSVAILCVHGVLAGLHLFGAGTPGLGDRTAWVWAGQAVGIFCGALLAVLIFALARQWGARFWPATAAAVLWALGKRISGYSVEGNSDMLALCFFAGSMLLAMRAMRFRGGAFSRRQAMQFAGCGFLAGLAYLTRPEGLAAPLIVAITLLLWWLRGKSARTLPQFLPRHALPTGALLRALAVMLFAAAVPAVPYMLGIGGLTHKKQILFASAGISPTGGKPLPDGRGSDVRLESLPDGRGSETRSPPPTAQWMLDEIGKTFSYACLAVLVLGLLWNGRLPGRPRLRLLALVWGTLWLVVMLWLLRSAGYLDGRHTLPLQVLLFSWLGVALQCWQRPVARAIRALAPHSRKSVQSWPALFASGVFIFVALHAAVQLRAPTLGGTGASAALAARWIQNHVRPEVRIADHQLLAGYFSGHDFAHWNGDFADPRTPVLVSLSPPAAESPAAANSADPPLLLGKLYAPGDPIPPSLGDFVPLALFQIAASKDIRGETYILYTLPGAPVLRDNP